MKNISGLTVLSLRTIDYLAKSPAPGLRSPYFCVVVLGLPKHYRLLLLFLVASQRWKVSPHF